MISNYANTAPVISTMSARSLVVLVVIFATVLAQRDSTCTTPNGKTAKCKPARLCKVIVDALNTGNSSAIEFGKKSQCGFDTEPLVCCGTSGYPVVLPSIFNILTKAPDIKPPSEKEQVEAIILSNFNTKELPDRTVCGIEKEANRVIGGTVAELGEFPWMAALEYRSKLSGENKGIRCGGSLINNRYVLTAAHCIQHIEFEPIAVWLGEWNITTDPDCNNLTIIECAPKVQKLSIKESIPHSYYSKRSGNNDIGLLRLERDIKYDDWVRPICLPPTDLPAPEFGTRMTVAGWGATENGTKSKVKLKVTVPLLTNDRCIHKLQSRPVSANQLCAGGEKGRDSCEGDSGGPLMRIYEDHLTEQNQWYQEGVVSRGVGCARAGYPAIYTRVNRYISWIINNIIAD